jgi:hypothetical protein
VTTTTATTTTTTIIIIIIIIINRATETSPYLATLLTADTVPLNVYQM